VHSRFLLRVFHSAGCIPGDGQSTVSCGCNQDVALSCRPLPSPIVKRPCNLPPARSDAKVAKEITFESSKKGNPFPGYELYYLSGRLRLPLPTFAVLLGL
jgi:hypothetical protein